MIMKRWLAAVLSVVMLLSAMPFATSAEGPIEGEYLEELLPSKPPGVVLDKTAQLQPDGTYTINLEAFATGETVTSMSTEGVPLDIVLVLDQSGSMLKAIDTTNTYTSSTADKTLGAIPGYYVARGKDANDEYIYYAVKYENGAWYYDSDPTDTALTWTSLSSSIRLFKSRLGALTEALNGFVDAVLADTHAYDTPVEHRLAIIGYAYGKATSGAPLGMVSPGSETDYRNKGFVNTGVFVDGVLKNYTYVCRPDSPTYQPETSRDYMIWDAESESYISVSYCVRCKAWFKGHSMHDAEDAKYGTIVTPKTSESDASGDTFYEVWSQTPDNFVKAMVPVNDGAGNLTASITTAISNIGAYGPTNAGYGVELAKNLFYYNPIPEGEARKRVVVVFSDGACESTNISMAVGSASELKNDYNATVFTVGLYGSGEETDAIKDFMNAISSSYPNASYSGTDYDQEEYILGDYTLGDAAYLPVYDLDPAGTYYIREEGVYVPITYRDGAWYNGDTLVQIRPSPGEYTIDWYQAYMPHFLMASNAAELQNIFTSIVTEYNNYTPNVELDATSVLADVLNPGLFKLGAGYAVTVQTQGIELIDGAFTAVGEPQAFDATVTVDEVNNAIYVKGFDYSTKFVSEGHPGEKLIVTITGVVGLDAAATGGKEFTNDNSRSGIFHDNWPVALFPKPTARIPSKYFVMDYAKPITIAVADLGLQSALDVGATMDRIDNAFDELDLPYGAVDCSSTALTYTPQSMNWGGYDSFYVFGKQDDTDAYEWVKVSVIPANNVYFEDDFVTTTDGKTVGIEYSGDWTVEGTVSGNTETPNGPIHGWEASLSDDRGYSDGAAHVSSALGASATFTFTGTGVDVYSRTNLQTGMIIATVTKDREEIANMALMVDNLAASGDYYQVPTLSIHTVYDSETQQEVPMPYGTYTVTLYVSDAIAVDEEGRLVVGEDLEPEMRSTYYLDGIRVYNPLVNEKVDTLWEPYDTEIMNAGFFEIRDLLIDANAFANLDSDDFGEFTATLIEKPNSLAPGDQIIIVAQNENFAMSTEQGENGRGQAAITKSADGKSVTFGADTQVITLVPGLYTNTFGFQVEGGYLYAGMDDAQGCLRTQPTLDEKASWLIKVWVISDLDAVEKDITHQLAACLPDNLCDYNEIEYGSSNGNNFYCRQSGPIGSHINIYRINNPETDGAVFIDQVEDKTTGQKTNVVGVYEHYGPKNEVYLAPGQFIVFRVDSPLDWLVGMKSLTGEDVTVRYTGCDGEKTISHTTDLYYKVKPAYEMISDDNGYIVIRNTGGGILALTKMRVTRPIEIDSDPGDSVRPISAGEAVAVVNAFSTNFVQKPIEYAWLDAMVTELFKSLETWFDE